MAFRDEGTDQDIAAAPQGGDSSAEIVAAEPAAADGAPAGGQSSQGAQAQGAHTFGPASRAVPATGHHKPWRPRILCCWMSGLGATLRLTNCKQRKRVAH